MDCIGIGGNGEGWQLTDVIHVARVALGELDGGGRWTSDLTAAEIARVRSIMGAEWTTECLKNAYNP